MIAGVSYGSVIDCFYKLFILPHIYRVICTRIKRLIFDRKSPIPKMHKSCHNIGFVFRYVVFRVNTSSFTIYLPALSYQRFFSDVEQLPQDSPEPFANMFKKTLFSVIFIGG